MLYFLLSTLALSAARRLRGWKATNSSCFDMVDIIDSLNCFYTDQGLLLTAHDAGTSGLPPPYNKRRPTRPLPIDGTLADFTLVTTGMNPIVYNDLGQFVQYNLPILIFPNAGVTAYQCIYAQDRGDPTGHPSCKDNMPPLISPDSDPVKTAQHFAAMYTTPHSPAYCAQTGIAGLGYWNQAGKDNFVATYKQEWTAENITW